jgi:hypothetical protein
MAPSQLYVEPHCASTVNSDSTPTKNLQMAAVHNSFIVWENHELPHRLLIDMAVISTELRAGGDRVFDLSVIPDSDWQI